MHFGQHVDVVAVQRWQENDLILEKRVHAEFFASVVVSDDLTSSYRSVVIM
jgi:hypothetical protein